MSAHKFLAAFFLCGLAITVLLCGLAVPAKAQDPTSVAREAAQADPSTRAIVQDGNPYITLESGKEGTLATGKIGFTTNINADRLQSLITFQAAPDSNGKASFLNLDGLTGGASATVKFTFKHFKTVLTGFPGEPFEQMCDDANLNAVKEFEKTHTDIDKVKACVESELRDDKATQVRDKLAVKNHEILEVMCQDINKKRGLGLLAPPGEDRNNIPGYHGKCSKDEIKAVKKKENEALEKDELQKACGDFNKAHSKGNPIDCSPGNLAEKSVDAEVASSGTGRLRGLRPGSLSNSSILGRTSPPSVSERRARESRPMGASSIEAGFTPSGEDESTNSARLRRRRFAFLAMVRQAPSIAWRERSPGQKASTLILSEARFGRCSGPMSASAFGESTIRAPRNGNSTCCCTS